MASKIDVAACVKTAAGGRKRFSIPGGDGRGLSLMVQGKSAAWELQWRDGAGKTRTKVVGRATSPSAITFTQANKDTTRVAIRNGGTENHAAESTGKTFGDALTEYLNLNAPSWRGGLDGKEACAHRTTLADLVPVALIDVDKTRIVAHLARWSGQRTSEKVRTRIKAVLDFAMAKDWLPAGHNPAARNMLKFLMADIPETENWPALPWPEVPALMKELTALDTPEAKALRFTILSAARTSETLGMRWSEVQGDNGTSTWIIPAARMKEKREHRVPLTADMLAIIGERPKGDDGLVFGHLPQSAMLDLLHTFGLTDPKRNNEPVVVHGFRSSFTDWAAEDDRYADDPTLADIALSHWKGSEVDKAYRRTDKLVKRRELAEAWGKFSVSDGKTGDPARLD